VTIRHILSHILDKSFALENSCDLVAHPGMRHLDHVLPRHSAVADARQHIGYGIGYAHIITSLPHQLALMTPGIFPSDASSLKQILHS
jgi:hypothetical protein